MLLRCCFGPVIKKSASRSLCNSVIPQSLLRISPKVQSAVASGRPVIALETTIVTHGMPYPDNIHTALQVEDIVRSHGVTPATIGVLHGEVHVGLTASQLEELGRPGGKKFKVSRRDLAYVLSQGYCGGTTVSGTMLCAHKAGIPLFVTGGIGGVHREGESTLDISADLTELGRTPVGVVCAGVKSILDIGRTLEYLETQGVTVASYGGSKEFPAFFSPKSGHEAAFSVHSPEDAAKLIDANLSFGVGSGLVIGVPIPTSDAAIGEEIERAICEALNDAKAQGITGKAVTPFLLERVNQLTEGRSLEANIKLIKNNARVGSQIAVELAKLRSGHSGRKRQTVRKGNSSRQPVVIGGSILDSTAKVTSPVIEREGTNAGSLLQTMGGVGRNIAECMSRLGAPPFFITALGRDFNGQTISHHLTQLGMSLDGVHECGRFSTATYCVVLDHHGELYCAVGDMSINESISVEWVSQFTRQLSEAPLVCLDGNVPMETLQHVCKVCSEAGVPVWYEPTCVDKAEKLILSECHSKITYSSPNISELRSIYSALTGRATSSTLSSELTASEKLSECLELAPSLLSHIPHLVISLGKDGVLSCSARQGRYLHYKPASDNLLPVKVVSVTGAGDSFVGAAAVGIAQGLSCDLSIKAGLRAAYESLKSPHAISSELCGELLTEESIRSWAPWEPTVIV